MADWFILIAAFVIFICWVAEGLIIHPTFHTAVYVYVTDGRWYDAVTLALHEYKESLDNIFGPKLLSFRALIVITLFSISINTLILFFGICYISDNCSDPDISPTLVFHTAFTTLVFTLPHDIISLLITRVIIAFKRSVWTRILIDSIICYALFLSTLSIVEATYHWVFWTQTQISPELTVASDFDRQHYGLWHLIKSTYGMLGEFIIPEYKEYLLCYLSHPWSCFAVGLPFSAREPIFVSSLTVVFPTIAYFLLLLLSFVMKGVFGLGRERTMAVLDRLSMQSRGKVAWYGTGLATLVLFLQVLLSIVKT